MESDYLSHHGIKGQRWGIRRYQNPDGTLTEEGKRRYGRTEGRELTEEGKKNLVDDYIKMKRHSGVLDRDGKKATNIANVIYDLIEEDEEFKKVADGPDIDKSILLAEKAAKRILGEAGKKLVYEDERNTQAYKLIGERVAIEYSARNAPWNSSKQPLKDKPRSTWTIDDASKLSDEVLKARVNRMQQEFQYTNNMASVNRFLKEEHTVDHPRVKQIFADTSAKAMSDVVETLAKRTVQNTIAKQIVENDTLYEHFQKNTQYRNEIFGGGGGGKKKK